MLFFGKTIVHISFSDNGRLQLIVSNCFLNVHNYPTKREEILRESEIFSVFNTMQQEDRF